MKYIIDGNVLLRNITGVERYAREILSELDKIAAYHEYTLALPDNCDKTQIPKYSNFHLCFLPGVHSHVLWEQISLPMYALKNKATIVNFDFTNYILRPGISTIHDMSFRVNKHYFDGNKKQRFVRWKLEFYCGISVRSANYIVTVSEFQKREICKYYEIKPERIIVAENAWQHFERINEDYSVLTEYNLPEGEFYFSLSSNTPNKNFKWVYEAAKANPFALFVIAGGKTSISQETLKTEKNIIYLGYQSDERIKALYVKCKAFIFPSYYEGFGIPPLEALSVGASVIVSNASCLPEVYEDSVTYINPEDPRVNLSKLIYNNKQSVKRVLEKYSWKKTAEIWHRILQ